MFPQYRHKIVKPRNTVYESVYNKPVLEGAAVIDVVAPINPATGSRDSFIHILNHCVNDPSKSRQISALMAEIPKIASDPRVSDDDRLDMCVQFFEGSTPAELDSIRRSLEPVVESLLKPASNVGKPSASPVSDSSSTVTTTAE